jgi:hypothetical protein
MQFIVEIKGVLKEILIKEVGLKVIGDRFYDASQNSSYPIQIVIFNDRNLLGYFEPAFYELGFHLCLMSAKKEQLRNVIRHELAHYIICMKYGGAVQPHGSVFRQFCASMGWGEEVYKASALLDSEQNVVQAEESSVLRKVKKLMALASSSNENEAELAMIKSQQLLLKHNVESESLCVDEEDQAVLKCILGQKRVGGKMRAIARILQTFFVHVIFRKARDLTYLEILGSSVNVEIALYVASFLDGELEKLWHQAQRMGSARGVMAKNSFFRGLAKGYCAKIEALQYTHSPDVTGALMVIEKQLTSMSSMVYARLSSAKSYAGHCQASSTLGEQMGKQLTINPAVDTFSHGSPFLLK